MRNLLLRIQPVVFAQILNHFRIGIHNEGSLIRAFCERSLFIDRIDIRQIITSSGSVIVFTKCRSRMDDSRTVGGGDIVGKRHEKGLSRHIDKRQKLFIFSVFEILALHGFQHFHRPVFFFQHAIHQLFSKIVNLLALAHFHILYVGMHGKRHIGRQRPRCRCPSKKILVLFAFYRKFRIYGSDFVFAITLCHFVGSKTCTTARAIRENFRAFID